MKHKFTATGTADLRIVIQQDNISEYFERLDKLFETEKKEMANTLMREMVGFPFSPQGGFIAPLMSKWNPYLYSTGQNSKYWVGESNRDLTTLEALYTGADINDFYGGKPPKGVWWEFATLETAHLDPQDRELERDYAYFQETGRDKIAEPRKARNKGAIEKGIFLSVGHLRSETEQYLSRLIQLKKGKHTTTGKRRVSDLF